jgi:hypothetical protein
MLPSIDLVLHSRVDLLNGSHQTQTHWSCPGVSDTTSRFATHNTSTLLTHSPHTHTHTSHRTLGLFLSPSNECMRDANVSLRESEVANRCDTSITIFLALNLSPPSHTCRVPCEEAHVVRCNAQCCHGRYKAWPGRVQPRLCLGMPCTSHPLFLCGQTQGCSDCRSAHFSVFGLS